MNTDSPLNYYCPTCGAHEGVACGAPVGVFHLSRRATRMASLARRSAATPREYIPTEYAPRNLHVARQTFIKRPAPQLPLTYGQPDVTNPSVLDAWERAVKATVDGIFAREAQS